MKKSILCCAIISTSLSSAVSADWADTLSEAISSGKTALNLRYRLESVEQDNARLDANASTLKTRLSMTSGSIGHWRAHIEFDNVSVIGLHDYDSVITGRRQFGEYSVVADPAGTDLNQANLHYKHEDYSLTLGKQRILHADQRFVGGVAWRQNEQTYDALRSTFKVSDIDVDYSYLHKVNRIFDGRGTSAQATSFSGGSHALHASSEALGGKLSAYTYLLDLEEAAALSSATYGVSYQAKFEQFKLSLAFASQRDYADNPVDYSANFYSVEGSMPLGGVTLALGREVLGSDGGVKAFTTPLATLHKFQGWADMFLATPNNGIQDNYIKANMSAGPFKLGLVYHDFSADNGSADYGSEWDLVATYPMGKKTSLQWKFADYRADQFGVDTQKVWMTFNVAL